MTEEWRPVVGYEDSYEVSSLGQVRRIGHGRGAVIGRILRHQIVSRNYPGVALSKNGIEVTRTTHTVVAQAFLGPAGGKQVNHRNGIKTDNRPENLEYVTQAENNRHAAEHDLVARGSRSNLANLNEEQVIEIKRLLPSMRQNAIARKFGVSASCINGIVVGKSWKWLKI